MVYVDVKHHVYLLLVPPSLISHLASVDVKQHVYLLVSPCLADRTLKYDYRLNT